VIEKAINKILTLGEPHFKDVAGKIFSDKRFTELKPEAGPVPADLKIKTLSGVVDYIESNLDDESDYLVHIDDYNRVTLYGKYDAEFCRRKCYIVADSQLKGFRYGQFMDVEEFIISILSYFSPNETLGNLLSYVAKLNDSTSITLNDDGITQNATIKTGVVSQTDKPVPNPVELIPYETFPEIEGVPRKFVFRLRKSSKGVECGIFESGDTGWKVAYIQKIKTYFIEELFSDANPGETLRISIIA